MRSLDACAASLIGALAARARGREADCLPLGGLGKGDELRVSDVPLVDVPDVVDATPERRSRNGRPTASPHPRAHRPISPVRASPPSHAGLRATLASLKKALPHKSCPDARREATMDACSSRKA